MHLEKIIRLAGDWAPCSRKVSKISIKRPLIINIEAPVFSGPQDQYPKSLKAGPALSSQQLPSTAQAGVAILANNHMMDFGSPGLTATMDSIQISGWSYAGAGLNKQQAEVPVIFDWAGRKAAVVARCETQFGIASTSKPGVAAFDPTIYQQISELKKQVDIVIVSIHAAAEMVPWPSLRRQATWRSLIDAGADVIHGHHAHVPQGWEKYKGGFIFYGLGNFCVDPQKWSWHPQGLWSLTPELELTENGIEVTISTTVIDELGESIRVREASDGEREKHMAYLEQCNRPLSDQILLEGLWQEASVRMYNDHFAKWLGFDSPSVLKVGTRKLRATLGAVKRGLMGVGSQSAQPANKGTLLLWYHLFACDSHNDAIGTALGVLSGEIEDRRNEESSQLVSSMIKDN